MNIFVTDPDPTLSAQHLPDKHVVKMPLETCQMLSIVCCRVGSWLRQIATPKRVDITRLRRVHFVITLVQYGQMIHYRMRGSYLHMVLHCEEYTYRYGRVHSCEETLLEATKILPETPLPFRPTSFVFAGH